MASQSYRRNRRHVRCPLQSRTGCTAKGFVVGIPMAGSRMVFLVQLPGCHLPRIRGSPITRSAIEREQLEELQPATAEAVR